MSTSEQTRLMGEPAGSCVEIETTGDVFRRFLALPYALANECRLRADVGGVGTTVRDPANVAVCEVQAEPEAFDVFDADGDGVLAGIDLDCLTTRAGNARMGQRTGDEIRVEIDASTTELEIRRTYGSTGVRQRDAWLNIDAAAVIDADAPTIEGTDGEFWKADGVDPDAFSAAIEGVDRASDYAELRGDGDDLAIAAEETDEDGDLSDATEVVLEDVWRGEADPVALFSLDYLNDIEHALRKARVDDLTVWFGDDLPVFIEFERSAEDCPRGLYHGRFCMAPRIRSDGPGGD